MESLSQNDVGAIESPVLAIDIGGTHVRVALFDPVMRAHREIPTLAADGAETVLRRLHHLVQPWIQSRSIRGVAVATAGQVNPQSGRVVDATQNLPGFRGLDLARQLRSWFAPSMAPPILIENDVNAALAAEAMARPNVSSLIVLALGTGVGGALMIDGHIVHGPHYFAGELGHMILHPHGRPCNCGQTGCLEQYVSGPGLLLTARQYYAPLQSPEDLFLSLAQGEPWARDAVNQFAEDLGLALTSLVNVIDPDLVVLAGGLTTTHAHWAERLTTSIRGLSRKAIPLAYTKFGQDSPLIGVVELFRQRYLVPPR